MRIAMVSEHASPLATLQGTDGAGQNVHVAELAKALARRGHSITVYTRRTGEVPERVPLAPGVDVVHIAAGPPVAFPKHELLPFVGEFGDGLALQWQADRPDVVHGHHWMSGMAALRASWSLGLEGPPVAQTFHALGHVKRRHQVARDRSPAERHVLEPAVARQVDQVVATSSDEAFELVRLGVAPRRISVVPGGVDAELFSPEVPAEPRTRPHRIVSAGRIAPRKGIGLTIEALGMLVAEGRDDVELVVVGGTAPEGEALRDPEVARLADLARSLGVERHVEFRGQVAHAALPPILRSADAVVCSPWYEPFGIVPLEAMACGIPVVVTAVGGLVDSVVHGQTGLHVPPRDPDALVRALRLVLEFPRLSERLGAAGAERVRAKYTWERAAADLEGIYSPLVSTRRTADARRAAIR